MPSSESTTHAGGPQQPGDGSHERASGLRLAAGLFSLLPVRPVLHIDRDAGRRAMLWFPWLGLLLGLISAAVMLLMDLVGASPLVQAVLGLSTLQLVTGFMHLDGIADTADGLGARKPNQDSLAIMKKPDTGPMGVSAIVLVLLVQVTALAQPMPEYGAFALMMLAPVVGRTACLLGTGSWVPCARPGGFGSIFAGTITPALGAMSVALTTGLTFVAGWLITRDPLAGAFMALSCLVALGIAYLWQRQLVARFAGLTGDMYGALIETASAGFLVLAGALL